VQLHADVNHETGEYAILLRSDLQGRGLGWLLMQTMIEYASADGLRSIEGEVLRENTTMLQMCGELGFKIEADLEDPGLCRVVLDLSKPKTLSHAAELGEERPIPVPPLNAP
jgi:acetyltransferase